MSHEISELVPESLCDDMKTECMPTLSRVSTTSGSEESQESQEAKVLEMGSRPPSQDETDSLKQVVGLEEVQSVNHHEKSSEDDTCDLGEVADKDADTSTDSVDLEDYDMSEDEGVNDMMVASATGYKQHKTCSDMKQKEKNVIFQPGRLGVDYDEDSVLSVEAGSPADEAGVAVGWKIRRLNGMRCTFFGDDLLIAALRGNVPFEVTFAIEDETNEGETSCSLAPAVVEEAKQPSIIPSCNNDIMEEELVEEPRESFQAPIMDTCIATLPAKTSEHFLMSDLKSEVTKQWEETKRMTQSPSVALAAAAKKEKEGKELLAALGAKISSREQDLDRKLAKAESMIRQLREREIDHELGISDDDDEHLGQSFSSCGTSSFLTGSWFGNTSFWESAPQNQRHSSWRDWFNTRSTNSSI